MNNFKQKGDGVYMSVGYIVFSVLGNMLIM